MKQNLRVDASIPFVFFGDIAFEKLLSSGTSIWISLPIGIRFSLAPFGPFVSFLYVLH